MKFIHGTTITFSHSIAEKFMVDTLQGCPDTFITTVNKYSLSYL